MMEYAKLPDLMKKCSSSVGFVVSLGAKFIIEGITQIDNEILPEIQKVASRVLPRVIPSYCILLWFTQEV